MGQCNEIYNRICCAVDEGVLRTMNRCNHLCTLGTEVHRGCKLRLRPKRDQQFAHRWEHAYGLQLGPVAVDRLQRTDERGFDVNKTCLEVGQRVFRAEPRVVGEGPRQTPCNGTHRDGCDELAKRTMFPGVWRL